MHALHALRAFFSWFNPEDRVLLKQGRGDADGKKLSGKLLSTFKHRGGKTDFHFYGYTANRQGGDMADLSEGGNGKARKRPTAKAATRQTVSKVKCTINLTAEASQRLDIHATMMGLDRSALVERLISDHLRRFVVSDRGGPDGDATDEAAA